MNNELLLKHGELTAEISAQGAWLTRLDQSGVPLLFPKQTIQQPDGNKKIRGGCHVCLPNFGPGGDSGLPQHGFARNLTWEVAEIKDSFIRLSLPKGEGEYSRMASELKYELSDSGVSMQLTVTNAGPDLLQVSPGFHPYFVASEDVAINGKTIDVTELHTAQTLGGEPGTISTAKSTYSLAAEQLNTWIVWSDMPKKYICIEPTYAGFSFTDNPQASLDLEPGAVQSWSLSIEKAWK
jgi:glucose-6-phosphate 1-epimerase